jgi:hypothetical protein
MKEIIDYLLDLGFEDANENFLFLQYLITCDKYEVECGLSVEEFNTIKYMLVLLDLHYESK